MKKRRILYRKTFALFMGALLMLPQSGCSRVQTREAFSGQVILSGQRQEETGESGIDTRQSPAETEIPDDDVRLLSADVETAAQTGGEQSDMKQAGQGQTLQDQPLAYIYVHICGEVQNPGVYRLPAGSRVYEGLEQAGGLLSTAASDAVNQALVLEDGMQVQIPSAEAFEAAEKKGSYITDKAGKTVGGVSGTQPSGTGASGNDTNVSDGRININTAGEAELCRLNGIGESRAKSIIRYRETHGSFARIEDIMKVEGIKEGAFAKIKDDITVE